MIIIFKFVGVNYINELIFCSYMRILVLNWFQSNNLFNLPNAANDFNLFRIGQLAENIFIYPIKIKQAQR